MPRTTNAVPSRKRRKKVLKRAKGFRGGRGKLYRAANETVLRAEAYSFVGRKRKKRDFRRLWIIRINAAARQNNMAYGELMHGLKKAGVDLDRKSLADVALNDDVAFKALVDVASKALAS